MSENNPWEGDVRRLLSVLLILALAASLTGCLGDASIDELLTAPTLSSRQSAVMSALERELGEQIAFVFPATGNSRAAIQFIDLDSDGTQEAVVFFRDTHGGINASVAVLRQEADGYAVTSITEGLGDRINSVRFLRSEDGNTGRNVLVEWGSRNAATNSMAVYTYTGSSLDLGFEESGTNLLVIEHPEDGGFSFCYLLPSAGDSMTVKSIRLYSGTSVSGHYSLDRSARSIRQMVTGETADGVLIFVDEATDSGFQTEVLRCDPSSHLGSAVTAEGYDILSLSSRGVDAPPASELIGGVMCFPSSVAPSADVLAKDAWIYWYSLSGGAVTLVRSGCYLGDYSCFAAIPQDWLSRAVVVRSEEAPNSLLIRDAGTGDPLMTMVILAVDEDAQGFISQGYKLVSGSGAFRYYVYFDCSSEEELYITQNFKII